MELRAIAATFVKEGHVVVASSRSDYTELPAQLGARYCRSAEEAIEQLREVIETLLCLSGKRRIEEIIEEVHALIRTVE